MHSRNFAVPCLNFRITGVVSEKIIVDRSPAFIAVAGLIVVQSLRSVSSLPSFELCDCVPDVIVLSSLGISLGVKAVTVLANLVKPHSLCAGRSIALRASLAVAGGLFAEH